MTIKKATNDNPHLEKGIMASEMEKLDNGIYKGHAFCLNQISEFGKDDKYEYK